VAAQTDWSVSNQIEPALHLLGEDWSVYHPMTPRTVEARTALFCQDTRLEWVHWVVRGIVKLTHLDQGGKQVILGLRYSGSQLGLETAILEMPSSVTATSVTTCQITRVPSQLVRQVLKTNPRLAWDAHRMLAAEVNTHVGHLTHFACQTTRSRLLLLIAEFSSMQHVPGRRSDAIHIPLRRTELAQILGVTPEHLSRMLTELQKEGRISLGKRTVVIHDDQPGTLANRA